jgi:hypothetical protein
VVQAAGRRLMTRYRCAYCGVERNHEGFCDAVCRHAASSARKIAKLLRVRPDRPVVRPIQSVAGGNQDE